MKKLIALLLIAGFFVVTLAGCPSPTTSGGSRMSTGSSTGGASTKP